MFRSESVSFVMMNREAQAGGKRQGGFLQNSCLQKGLCVKGQVVLKGADSNDRAAAGCKVN